MMCIAGTFPHVHVPLLGSAILWGFLFTQVRGDDEKGPLGPVSPHKRLAVPSGVSVHFVLEDRVVECCHLR